MIKTKTFFFLSIITIVLFSCKKSSEKDHSLPKNENLSPKINVEKLLTNYKDWWTYHSNNIVLNSDFAGYDIQSNKITKNKFLKLLKTSSYIPIKLKSTKKENHYKLYKLPVSVNTDISKTIKYESLISLKYFEMEGRSFPEFNLTALDKKNYTNKNTKGKITVFKTWFINCQACIAEFGELNNFVDKNKATINFISLATDFEEKLKSFLQKRPFKYAVVANQKEFIEKQLKFTIYPTHIVVDEQGIILKITNSASEMISFVENRTEFNKKLLPPPPSS